MPSIEAIFTIRPRLSANIERTTHLVNTSGDSMLTRTNSSIRPSGILAKTPLDPSAALFTSPYDRPRRANRGSIQAAAGRRSNAHQGEASSAVFRRHKGGLGWPTSPPIK